VSHQEDGDEDYDFEMDEEEEALIQRAIDLSLLLMDIKQEDVDEVEFEIFDNGNWSLVVTKLDGTVLSGSFSNHPKGTHPGSNSRH
jgi:hypothetical protein